MAKSPNGKIVKSLYLKIAYVWTRPNEHFAIVNNDSRLVLAQSATQES